MNENGVMKWYPIVPECVRINAAGVDYEEFSCVAPTWLARTYMDWEFQYNLASVRDWMRENPIFPTAVCMLYGILIVAGRRYFATRDRWNWRYTLAAWNLGLSVFSAFGLFRTLPKLVYNFTNYSLQENFCLDPESSCGSGATGLWVQLFILSKFPELFDTFFIVIHKKPLIFLHWYHHITVLLYCWHSYVAKFPPGFVFVVMNYAVHSIMYFYYFLMAVRAKPKAFKAVYITLAQISQMVVGVAITILSCYYLYFDPTFDTKNCFLTERNNLAALVMYGSYLFLFLQFFLGRYFQDPTKPKVTSNGQYEKKIE